VRQFSKWIKNTEEKVILVKSKSPYSFLSCSEKESFLFIYLSESIFMITLRIQTQLHLSILKMDEILRLLEFQSFTLRVSSRQTFRVQKGTHAKMRLLNSRVSSSRRVTSTSTKILVKKSNDDDIHKVGRFHSFTNCKTLSSVFWSTFTDKTDKLRDRR